MNGIIKLQQQLHTFHYLTKHAGKEVNGYLKKLIMKNDDGVLKTMVDRTSIETEIIKYNKNFFEEPIKTKVYKDRIYERLNHQSIRNKILAGTLRNSECDDPDLYEFLKLLKKP